MPRDFEAHRKALDGEDAVLWDVTSEVLIACGVTPEESGRKVRRAVAEALRLHCMRSGASLEDARILAAERWKGYAELGRMDLLFGSCGVRQFFATGLWLTPELWPLDRRRLAEIELRRNRR